MSKNPSSQNILKKLINEIAEELGDHTSMNKVIELLDKKANLKKN